MPAEPATSVDQPESPARPADAFHIAVEQAKLDAMKELAYGASHEINNPLANIAARAQTMLRREHDPDKRKMLQAIHRQAMRAHEMISDLMLFARPPRLEKQRSDITESIASVLEELGPFAEERSIRLHGPGSSARLEATFDRVQLEGAIKAVVTNSIEAMDVGGEVAVEARRAEDGGLEITLRDTGPGIAAEVREHLFDPFYSGREAGRGLGFGLAKCWRIVTEHGGKISVKSPPGQGAVFTINLPDCLVG
jgi:signal transduction histidine kinase